MFLENSFRNHFRVWSFHLGGSILILMLLFLVQFQNEFVLAAVIVWGIFTVPALYLYFEYLYLNYAVKIEVKSNSLIYRKKNDVYNIPRDQISAITFYMTPGEYINSNIKYLPIESFRYVLIELNYDRAIIITNLLSANIESDLALLDLPIKRKKKLFCSPHITYFNFLNW